MARKTRHIEGLTQRSLFNDQALDYKQPNEHGVYPNTDCECLNIPIKKTLKAEIKIYLVLGSDGFWRESTDYQFLGQGVGDGGAGSFPHHHGKKYLSRLAALSDSIRDLRKSIFGRPSLNHTRKAKVLAAIDDFTADQFIEERQRKEVTP